VLQVECATGLGDEFQPSVKVSTGYRAHRVHVMYTDRPPNGFPDQNVHGKGYRGPLGGEKSISGLLNLVRRVHRVLKGSSKVAKQKHEYMQ
jgi:hypothetical protein